MKTIKILGPGCAKCKKTEEIVRQVVAEMGVEAKIEKVEDIMEIMSYNVMYTPAVMIDGEVKIKGRIPFPTELKNLLS